MSSGREQRRGTTVAKIRTPDLSAYYRHRLPTITPGDFEFELELLRPKLPALPLQHMVDTLNWIDEQSVMTGSITAYRPDATDPTSLPIVRGQLVRCRVRWGGSHKYELWTMRCEAPQTELETGQVTVPLKDDLAKLDEGKRDWNFRTTKHRPHGYFLHDIAKIVAQRTGVRLGHVVKGTHRMTFVKRKMTALAVLRYAAGQEKQASGRSLLIRMRNGRLDLIPLQRNPIVYVLARQIQTAQITQKAGAKVPVTVITGRARLGKGKDTKKISYTHYDRTVVRSIGYVHDHRDYGHVSSHGELRRLVKRDLAKSLRVNDTITIQHQGIPFIERGDAARVDLPREGYKGEQGWVFCTRSDHTVQSGVYQSTFDFGTRDAYLAQQQADAKAKQQRADKRAGRGSGSGAWKTVTATYFSPADAGGAPACGGGLNANGGLFYAELGTAGANAGHPALGPLFGFSGELPCFFKLEVRNPVNGKSAVAVKNDRGSGAPGASIDAWIDLANLLGFTSIGKGPLQIRAA